MRVIDKLIEKNKAWADQVKQEHPDFFKGLAYEQHPEILWIGCVDSRVATDLITGMEPGQLFVHRNVANLVPSTDFNSLSVIQYAVDYLKVKYIIVCGHYNCGGVIAAYNREELGLIDNWIGNIRNVYHTYKDEIEALKTTEEQTDLLCELNVKQQVRNVCNTSIVQNAWKKGQEITVCGMIYSVKDGLLKDLGIKYDSTETIPDAYIFK